MRPRQPIWRLALLIVLICVASVFTLGVVAVGLTIQPYVLVVAHNLTGAPVNLDLGITGSAMRPRRVGAAAGRWACSRSGLTAA